MKSRARGLVTVEFAIIGSAMLMILIGCVELGRAFFVWNSLAEGSRRAARLASVCPVNHASVSRAAVLSAPGGSAKSPYIADLNAAQVSLQYLDASGAATATFANIRYVRVGFSGYQHELMVPFFKQSISVPAFWTTVPVESLGYQPESGLRQCFGT